MFNCVLQWKTGIGLRLEANDRQHPTFSCGCKTQAPRNTGTQNTGTQNTGTQNTGTQNRGTQPHIKQKNPGSFPGFCVAHSSHKQALRNLHDSSIITHPKSLEGNDVDIVR